MRALIIGLGILLTGCATYTKLELKPRPPREHRSDLSVIVEYVQPERVGARCAEIGGSAFALACANAERMILPNPCAVTLKSSTDALQCHEIGHANDFRSRAP